LATTSLGFCLTPKQNHQTKESCSTYIHRWRLKGDYTQTLMNPGSQSMAASVSNIQNFWPFVVNPLFDRVAKSRTDTRTDGPEDEETL